MSSVTLIWSSAKKTGRAVTETDEEYELLDLLGRGGMATVYLARHRASGRKVALKLVARSELEHLSSRGRLAVQRRLLREARAVGAIQHPNVVEFIDAGLIGGCVYVAMEHLDGCSLADALGERDDLPWSEVASIGAMIASGVAAGHAVGIVHRDLKPGNVMLLPREPRVVAKVFDFGIAKLRESAHGLTLPGTTMGTPRYMSPEQCRGDELDHRTDIYSLGVLLYRALAGHCPFEHPDEGELMRMHEEAPVPPLAVDGLPEGFAAIIARCLRKQPAERFASMQEVVAALEALRPARAARGTPTGTLAGPPPAPAVIIPPMPPPAPPPAPPPPPVAVVPPVAVAATLPLRAAPPSEVVVLPTATATAKPPAVPAPGLITTQLRRLRRHPWAIRSIAGALVLAVAMLGWLVRRPTSAAARSKPPGVAIAAPRPAPPPAPPPPVVVEIIPAPDPAVVAAWSSCWERVRTRVEGRRRLRARPLRSSLVFVATCPDELVPRPR